MVAEPLSKSSLNKLDMKRFADGTHLCNRCGNQFVPWTDARAATDMARLQGIADKDKIAVAIDDIVTFVPCRARQTAKAEAKGAQEGRGKRSTVGILKDLARKYVTKAAKLGFKDVIDRMENDALFAYLCSLSNINCDGMLFLERLSRAIFPNFGRTFEERAKGTGKAGRKAEPMEFDDLSVKLVFIPRQDKPADEDLTIATGAFIAYKSRFFTTNQFVRYLKRFVLSNPREEKPIVFGWRARQYVPEGEAEDMLKHLTNFAMDELARCCCQRQNGRWCNWRRARSCAPHQDDHGQRKRANCL